MTKHGPCCTKMLICTLLNICNISQIVKTNIYYVHYVQKKYHNNSDLFIARIRCLVAHLCKYILHVVLNCLPQNSQNLFVGANLVLFVRTKMRLHNLYWLYTPSVCPVLRYVILIHCLPKIIDEIRTKLFFFLNFLTQPF